MVCFLSSLAIFLAAAIACIALVVSTDAVESIVRFLCFFLFLSAALLRNLAASTSINSIPSSNDYSRYISLLTTALAAVGVVLG